MFHNYEIKDPQRKFKPDSNLCLQIFQDNSSASFPQPFPFNATVPKNENLQDFCIDYQFINYFCWRTI